eukprot:s831_g3.t1
MDASSGDAKKVNAPRTPLQLGQTGQPDEAAQQSTLVETLPRGDTEVPAEPTGSKPEETERAEGEDGVPTSPADLPPPEIVSDEEGGEPSAKRAKKEQKYLETIGKAMHMCQKADFAAAARFDHNRSCCQ